MEQMEISYQLTQEEIQHSLIEVWKTRKLLKTIIFAVVFFLLSADFFWIHNYFVAIVCLVAGAAVILVPYSSIKKASAQSENAHLLYRVRLEGDKCRICVGSPSDEEGHCYDVGYTDIYRIYSSRQFFIFSMTRDKIIPLPKRVLSEEQKKEAEDFFIRVFQEKYKPEKK